MSGSRGQDRDDELADKLACEAIRNVLGAHKLTCDEHENLQQDFKDVALAALRRAKAEVWREAEKLGMEQSPHHTECALKWARECLARAAQIEALEQEGT